MWINLCSSRSPLAEHFPHHKQRQYLFGCVLQHILQIKGNISQTICNRTGQIRWRYISWYQKLSWRWRKCHFPSRTEYFLLNMLLILLIEHWRSGIVHQHQPFLPCQSFLLFNIPLSEIAFEKDSTKEEYFTCEWPSNESFQTISTVKISNIRYWPSFHSIIFIIIIINRHRSHSFIHPPTQYLLEIVF